MYLSGEQIEIASGPQRATITTAGATLRAYSHAEWALLDGFAADEVCSGGRGQLLMPWPNRIALGRYELAGCRYQLPIDELELGHAIHGLVRWSTWQVEKRGNDFARLRHCLQARPGYPFPLDLFVEYRLSDGGLAVTMGAANLGAVPCPFGAGAHPYLRFPAVLADAVELAVPATEWLEVDARAIPTRRRPVKASPFDFQRPRAIGPAHLDHAFTSLERDANGLARVLLRARNQTLQVWLDRNFAFVQIYTGDTLPDHSRRRQGIAVEPTTCAPDAFNNGDGLKVLAPGATFEGHWGIAT
jgi:aldose 1-epimerase